MGILITVPTMPFQSTPSVGRETRETDADNSETDSISIHSLRGEGDIDSIVNLKWFPISISIHSLRGEGDGVSWVCSGRGIIFQSTPSVGRETYCDR